MGDGSIHGGGGGGRDGGGEDLVPPSLLHQMGTNGMERAVVGMQAKLGHNQYQQQQLHLAPPKPTFQQQQQQHLLAMMDLTSPLPNNIPQPHPQNAPPLSFSSSSTSTMFNPHHQQHHFPPPHFASQLPTAHSRYLHAPPPPASIFPYHHQHHIDFSLPHNNHSQQQQLPFSPHSHLLSPPSTLVFSSSPTPPGASTDHPTSNPAGSRKRGGSGGLNKLCGVSPALQAIVGEPAMPRTQIVKQLWAYIRKNNLQDPSNKRKIICNDELRVVFETDCTDMFKMNKLLAKHITPLEPKKIPGPESKKIKTEDSGNQLTEQDQPTIVLSDALTTFFDTTEKEMLQSEAIQRIMDYVKLNHLEDPLDSKVIQCDSKLQDLFGSDSFSPLAIPELLERHFIKHQAPQEGLGTD